MANYSTLKAAINAAIKTNTTRDITGNVLNTQLNNMVSALGAGFQYMGVATPSTSPGTPDHNVVYAAATAGTYTGFSDLVLDAGEVALLKYNGTWVKETVRKGITLVTWSDLKTLRDGGKLVPGAYYRITDYVTTTVQAESQSAGHQFDMIVRADSATILSEEAWAIQHEGDTYFSESNLAAWRVWYCLDNDSTRFAWADINNGKGVIWRMIDEFQNDVAYDFKNIQFKRYKITAHSNTALALVNKFSGAKTVVRSGNGSLFPGNSTISTSVYRWAYTFEGTTSENTSSSDRSLKQTRYTCGSNKIPEFLISGNSSSEKAIRLLNNIVFYCGSYNCHSNTFGANCYSNTFGANCYSNTFGANCYSNTFGGDCSSNTFGNNCYSNTFGNNCYSNTFGNNCSSNTFGNNCSSNTFGNNCSSNTFGYDCSSNTFGYDCSSNTFGNNCYSNTFGNNCYSNTFGNYCSSNTFGNYCSSNTFGNGCSSNTFGNYCYSNTFLPEIEGVRAGDYVSKQTIDDLTSPLFGFRLLDTIDLWYDGEEEEQYGEGNILQGDINLILQVYNSAKDASFKIQLGDVTISYYDETTGDDYEHVITGELGNKTAGSGGWFQFVGPQVQSYYGDAGAGPDAYVSSVAVRGIEVNNKLISDDWIYIYEY